MTSTDGESLASQGEIMGLAVDNKGSISSIDTTGRG